MKYELAKKLKDAGFPQKHDTMRARAEGIQGEVRTGVGPDDDAYAPTLTELIDACGGQYFTLTNADTNQQAWQAICDQTKAEGNTPDEAAANCWLALNPHGKN